MIRLDPPGCNYYFDKNCSYILLVLLETGNPEWQLIESLPVWVTPTETLHTTIAALGTKEVEYRASALSRYRERYDSLNARERENLAQLISSERTLLDKNSVESKKDQQEVRVFDAALEYFDFIEKLGGNNTAKRYASLRSNVLSARSKISLAPEKLSTVPWSLDPSQARSESWLSLGLGSFSEGQRVRLGFQPVLQDLLSNPTGYSEGMEIQLLPMQVDIREQQAFLSQLDLLKIVSITPFHRLLSPPTWALAGAKKSHAIVHKQMIFVRSLAWR